MNTSLSGLERQIKILQMVSRNQRINLSDICETFVVSEATARRDLESLASQGKVQRVHGGAIAKPESPPGFPTLLRDREQAEEKIRIGRAAAALVQRGETVFLGPGTTVLEVARALRARPGVIIITNSLPVVNVFAGLEDNNLICLGGVLRGSDLSFFGHITNQALAEVHADMLFIGTRAISLENGLMHEYPPETMTDHAILKAGQKIILVADHTKFGRAATVRLAPLESIHTIVTDLETPQDFVDAARERGLQVILV